MATAATAAGALRASCPPSALEPTPDPGPRVPTAKGRVGDNRSAPRGAHEHAPLGQPQGQVCLLGPIRRNVVVAAIGSDLVASLQREELAVPSVLLGPVED